MLSAPDTAYKISLFKGMEYLLPEAVWALLFLLHGTLALFCCITHRKDLITFIFDVTFGMLLWNTATVALIISSLIIPAHLSAQIILSLCTLWLFIRFNLQKE